MQGDREALYTGIDLSNTLLKIQALDLGTIKNQEHRINNPRRRNNLN